MSGKPKLGQCQVEGCNRLARWALYRTNPDGRKVWLHVCDEHERIIGNENMRRAGGRYEPKGGESDAARKSAENSQ